jgi:uncharacterized protein
MLDRCRWINEPARWRLDGDRLSVTTDDRTDFWRETHYGFTRHSGHCFAFQTAGDFTADLRVRADYREQYDQAGIMVRLDEANWVKAGIERTDGRPGLGSVLTIGRSDWATGIFEGNAEDFWIRATVAKGVLKLQASADGKVWPTLRLCPFPPARSYGVGPFCCTPERSGLNVLFSDFRVGPPLNKGLHDLS